MRLFALSMSALKIFANGAQGLATSSGYADCDTEEQAIEQAFQFAYEIYPPSEGFTYHTVNVFEIPRDFIHDMVREDFGL